MKLVYIGKHGDYLVKVYCDNADWAIFTTTEDENLSEDIHYQVWRTRHSEKIVDVADSFAMALDAALEVNSLTGAKFEVIKPFNKLEN